MDATRGILVVTKLKFSSNGEVRRKMPYHLPRLETTHSSALHIFHRAWTALHPLMPCWLLMLKSTIHGSLLQANCLFPQDLPSKHTTYHITLQLLKPAEVSVQNTKPAQWSQVLCKIRIKFTAAHFFNTQIKHRALLQSQRSPHHDSSFHY